MARATGNPRYQAARLGLLVALAVGCATIQEPPGGPPDFTPPTIVSVTPDSGAVADGFRDDAVIQFDEVINERSGGALSNLVRLSPRPDELSVSWKRTRIAVKPKGGWRADVVYHLTLLAGVTDLQNNRLDSTRTIIFSTGGAIPATTLTGTVIDWEEGRLAPNALLEAVLIPDSLTYTVQADSAGHYRLTAVPEGTYLVFATIDQNGNGLRDSREAFDSARVYVDSAATQVLWTFAHDSVGPRITTALIDSTTLRVSFTQKLSPRPEDSTHVSVFALPDTVPVSIANIWTPAVHDSIRAVQASAARDSADAEAEADPDSVVQRPPRERRPERPPVDSTAAAADTSGVSQLLAERPKLIDALVVRLLQPLTPGARFLVVARARNVAGGASESQSVLVVPAVSDSS